MPERVEDRAPEQPGRLAENIVYFARALPEALQRYDAVMHSNAADAVLPAEAF